MQIVIINDDKAAAKLAQIHKDLLEGSEFESKGKKMREMAKAALKGLLANERGVDVEKMKVGDSLFIKHKGADCILIEVSSRMGLNQTKLKTNYPNVFTACYELGETESIKPNKGFKAD